MISDSRLQGRMSQCAMSQAKNCQSEQLTFLILRLANSNGCCKCTETPYLPDEYLGGCQGTCKTAEGANGQEIPMPARSGLAYHT